MIFSVLHYVNSAFELLVFLFIVRRLKRDGFCRLMRQLMSFVYIRRGLKIIITSFLFDQWHSLL